MAITFTSDKSTLLSAISPALYATSNKSTLPALEGLLITLEGNTLTVCGYDLEKGIRTTSAVFGKEDGAVVLNSAKLIGIIKNFPECNISFTGDENNVVTIIGGDSEFTLHGIDATAFPAMPDLSGENRITINSGVLKEIISSTNYAVAATDSRPVLMGELFDINGSDLTVVSADNYRLAKREVKNCVTCAKDKMSFIIPGKALSDLSKLIDDDDSKIYIEFTRKYVIFICPDIIMFSRLLEGEFLDYKRVIPTCDKTTVRINRLAFIESVERASLFVDEKLRTPIKCSFEGDTLNVFCSTHFGKVNDNIKMKLSGEDIVIGFNNKYLLEALRICKGEEIILKLQSPLMSMLICPTDEKEDNTTLHLVLPMKLKA